jgi:hypothetical protein
LVHPSARTAARTGCRCAATAPRRSRGATIGELPVGRTVEILCVYEKDPKFLEFLDERGLRPGVRMRIAHREYDETTTVTVAGRKVYLGKPATSRIWGRVVTA